MDIGKKSNPLCNKVDLALTEEIIILGTELEETAKTDFINVLLIETKWQIWINRNNVKFDSAECMADKSIYNSIVNDVKYELCILKHAIRRKASVKDVSDVTKLCKNTYLL